MDGQRLDWIGLIIDGLNIDVREILDGLELDWMLIVIWMLIWMLIVIWIHY